ncbi:substrate-binding periplasmic protein [Inhella proteolytica]|uniref:Transporter substrate-binding domain-containing protein n=1 Tax=Inhella proteolytica TaxID=2795029 RepID=A0A931J223_9BURK|nr:transporter substrate-binding domain-containing protein [Inhella proteolytica]MBH9576896.1 transporter substrate-binding domain-containing protein [Inhella proteolytica]
MCRLLAFAFLLLGGAAWAQPAVLRMVSNEFPPYVGKDLPQQGFYAALVRQVLAEQGLQLELQFQPPARAHASAAAGQVDAAFPMLRTPEREREFLFSEPLLLVRSYLFVRADSPISGLADLPGRRSCHLQDSNQPEPVQRLVEGGSVKVERVAQMAQCFEMLTRGRVDFVALSDYGGWAAARQATAGPEGFKRVGAPLSLGLLHLVWPRAEPRSAERAAAFNKALTELRRRGVVAQLERELLPALPEPEAQAASRALNSPAGRGR